LKFDERSFNKWKTTYVETQTYPFPILPLYKIDIANMLAETEAQLRAWGGLLTGFVVSCLVTRSRQPSEQNFPIGALEVFVHGHTGNIALSTKL
jgi:hypothetical protein